MVYKSLSVTNDLAKASTQIKYGPLPNLDIADSSGRLFTVAICIFYCAYLVVAKPLKIDFHPCWIHFFSTSFADILISSDAEGPLIFFLPIERVLYA